MKAWSAFLKDVRPGAPAVAENVLEHHVLRAAQDFCKRTRAWIVELDPTVTVEDQQSYDMELDRVELVRLEGATFNGIDYEIWRAGDAPRGRYLYTGDGKTFEFSQPVAAGLPVVLRCSVSPANNATGIDDALFDRYVALIALKAVSLANGDDSKRSDYEAQCDALKTRLWRGLAATRPRVRLSLM